MSITAYRPFRDGSGTILEMREQKTDRFRRDAKLKDLRTHFGSYYTFGTFESPKLRLDWVTDDCGLCMWFEEVRTTPPRSGYTPCACRDCMDVTVSGNLARPELCELCQEAGCGDPDATTWPECQRDDAYDMDDAGAPSWPCKSCTTECYCTGDHDADTDCEYCEINAEVHCP